MDIDLEAIKQTFLVESLEHLSSMEEALVFLEGDPGDTEAIETIFRAVHTLKGNSASLGFPKVAEFAHHMEDTLHQIRKGTLDVTSGLVTLLLQSVDAFRQMIPEAVVGVETLRPEHEEILKSLSCPVSDREEREKLAAELAIKRRRVRPFGRRVEDAQEWVSNSKTLRVDINKLDRILNLTGELSIARGRVRQMLEGDGNKEDLLEANRSADTLFMGLQEQILKVRMVPAGSLFRQHFRTVRDMARATGKAAHLKIEGGDVELDTTVVEHLKDPITHMIRNAMDHGIETPEQRKRSGKDPSGSIILRAFHDGGNIIVQLEDDGRGLDRRKILKKAVSMQLIPESRVLSQEEINRLIFEPGFSSTETVSDFSGRGVGLDVVLRNINALRGTVGVESTEGKGTKITIRLPLTLAIIEGFAVGVEGETYIVPLVSVTECRELDQEAIPSHDGTGVVNLRGKVLPYVHLRHLFHLGGSPPARESMVVIDYGEGGIGLVVDVLYGETQTVIKPLGKLFQGLPGVSGSAILGNGRVALILDVSTLIPEVLKREGAAVRNG